MLGVLGFLVIVSIIAIFYYERSLRKCKDEVSGHKREYIFSELNSHNDGSDNAIKEGENSLLGDQNLYEFTRHK
jgi:hypothetical protein